MIVYRSASRIVPSEDWEAVRDLVRIIFSLTPGTVPEDQAAGWALRRAAETVKALRFEAERLAKGGKP